jgi:tRNA nucleotidyltransferase (CCA-adding enzyme)
MERGRLRSIGHTEAGEAPTRSFLARMTGDVSLTNEVAALVREHLRPVDLFANKAGDSAIRRLAARVGRIDRLVRVVRADQEGRGPNPPPTSEALDWLLERARRLEVEASVPMPLVMGRHLVALGMKPGPAFKPVLSACYEAQLDGIFSDSESGVAWARKQGLIQDRGGTGGREA